MSYLYVHIVLGILIVVLLAVFIPLIIQAWLMVLESIDDYKDKKKEHKNLIRKEEKFNGRTIQ